MSYKNIFQCLICIFSIFGSTQFFAATPKQNSTDLLIAKTLAPTPILDDLRYLTDVIGGRPTGSVALNNATQWGLAKFKAAGFKDAYLEAYTAPRNWLPNVADGEIILPHANKQNLRLAAMPFSASTATAGLEANVYAVESADVKDIKSHAKQIKGHWLLIPTTPMRTVDDLFNEYLKTPPVFTAAQQVGAAGILWQSNRSGRLLYRHNATINAELVPLPAALIEREGAEQIIRALKSGEPVTAKIILQNIVQEQPRNFNVVAEIKGSKKPDEVIILGAHLDSWELGHGALDNGCNAVMVMDVARQMMALAQAGHRPERTVRFILYSGEELGLLGSWFDVKNNQKTLDKIKAVVIFDLGTGRTTGFSLGGRSDMLKLVKHALQPVSSLGPFTQTTDAFFGTDNFDYLLQGIPTLVANQDVESYLPSYHAESDTFDKVDARELKLNTAISSVLVWNLANTAEKFPPRQTPVEVKKLAEATDLKKQMEIYNIWNSYINHQR